MHGNLQSSTAAILQSANLFVMTMNNPVRWIDPTGLFAEYVELNSWLDSRNVSWLHFSERIWDESTQTKTVFIASNNGLAGRSFTIGVDGTHFGASGQMYVNRNVLHDTFDHIIQTPGLVHRPVTDAIIAGVAVGVAIKLVPTIVRWLGPATVASAPAAERLVKKASQLNRTATVMNHVSSRPYIQSTQLIQHIMQSSKPLQDPQTATGLRWVAEGTFNGSHGAFELVINPNTETILHFLFRSH